MTNVYSFRLARLWLGVALLWAGSFAGTLAQGPVQITRVSSPETAPTQFATYNGRLYFSAKTDTDGEEVYSTDGTLSGSPRLLKNINTGGGTGSDPREFTVFNGRLYFVATSATRGRELWATDGTADGTVLVKDIHNPGSGDPKHLTVCNGRLYFTAVGNLAHELWFSDGTAAGTVQVSNALGVPTGGLDPVDLTASGDKLFYRAGPGLDKTELWFTNGTAAFTKRVEIGRQGLIWLAQFKAFEGKLIFRAAFNNDSDEPWISDGTSEGTFSLAPGPARYVETPGVFSIYNGRAYFYAVVQTTTVTGNVTRSITRYGLCSTDGTRAGTQFIKPLSQVYDGVVFNGKLYFSANEHELWATDGTEAGTQRVKSLIPSGLFKGIFEVVGNKLYFVNYNPFTSTVGDNVLWESDGTGAGTRLLADVYPVTGNLFRAVRAITQFNDELYFTAPPGGSPNPELFRLLTNQPAITTLPARTGSVGQYYFQSIAPLIALSGPRSYRMEGLPPGLSFNGGDGGLIGGTPTTAGVYPVTYSVANQFGIVLARATFPFTITQNQSPVIPPIADQTISINQGFVYTLPTITDPEGQGLIFLVSGLPAGFSFFFSDEEGKLKISGQTPLPGTYTVTVKATDAQGLSASTSFRLTVNAMGGTSRLQLTGVGYNCFDGAIRFSTSGGDATPITFIAPGIQRASPTDDFGTVEAELRNDPKPIVIQAIQSGVTAEYTFDLPRDCPGVVWVPLRLLAPTYNCETGAILFRTNGGDAGPITFTAPGIQRNLPTDRFGIVETELRNDPKPILIQATQGNHTITYTFDLPAACGGSARRGAVDEPGQRLSVRVLGNPVVGETVQVEVSGAGGQALKLVVADTQGRPVSTQQIEQAAPTETRTVRLGQSAGLYLLRVSTLTQSLTVKVLKE